MGISGSVIRRRTRWPRTAEPYSPLAHRVGAGDDLHLGEQVAHRLGVLALSAERTSPRRREGRPLDAARREDLLDHGVDLVRERAGVDPEACSAATVSIVWQRDSSAYIGQTVVEPGDEPAARLLGARASVTNQRPA